MRKEKEYLLDAIDAQIKGSGSFVLMSYQGLSANLANDFRCEVEKMGGTVQMVRKRLLVKAAKGLGFEIQLEQLPGHIGVVQGGTDVLETTKYLFRFGKDHENMVNVIGGSFEGELHDAATMKQLSELPSKDEMRAQFLATLEAPLSQTLSTMQALLCSVLYCLENKSQKN